MKNLLASFTSTEVIIIYSTLIAILLICVFVCASCYKKCPAGYIMVVYSGKLEDKNIIKCINGGVAFVIPFVQKRKFFSLAPINASSELEKVDLKINYCVALSIEPNGMLNAADKLFLLTEKEIENLAKQLVDDYLKSLNQDDLTSLIETLKSQNNFDKIKELLYPYGFTLIDFNC